MHIAYDLGGVLVTLDPDWPRHADLDPSDVIPWMVDSDAFARFEVGELSEERFLAALAERFSRDPHVLQGAFERWVTGHHPGAAALLEEVPGSFLSNTNRLHWQVFDPERILRSRAIHPLASHHIGARKPTALAFERASKIFGTADVLLLDDNLANVDAARAFGWKAEQVEGPTQAREALEAHGAIRSTSA